MPLALTADALRHSVRGTGFPRDVALGGRPGAHEKPEVAALAAASTLMLAAGGLALQYVVIP